MPIAFAVAALLALPAFQAARAPMPLSALTVPSDRLPDGCRLTPESNSRPRNRRVPAARK